MNSLYIAGEWLAGQGEAFQSLNPVTQQVLWSGEGATAAQVESAVQAARQAFPGWARRTLEDRISVLEAFAVALKNHADELARTIGEETGKPLWEAATEVTSMVNKIAISVQSYRERTGEKSGPLGDATAVLRHKPHGVVAIISPWNLPLLLLTWKVAPALACGNSVVVKPSEDTPSSATLLAEVMRDAGVPAGVFNLVHGFGPGSAGEFLTAHRDVDAITFTGESRTGATIMKAAAEGVREVSFELGGKNAAVVFADCDFDAAVAGVLRSSFTNAGQVCLCSERVYVERPIYERFVAALKAGAEQLKIGYPDEDGVNMGSLISHKHRDKVLGYFQLALEEGATLVSGGGIPQFGDARDQGAYVQPTIWTDLPDHARCLREEVFGPVCHIAPFDTEEEVVRRANDSN